MNKACKMKWIKWPGPGEFRGEGKWYRLSETGVTEADWLRCRETGYLPTHEGEHAPKAAQADEKEKNDD